MANINENAGVAISQTSRILSHLLEGKSITALEALDLYGCLRLSARIKDIEIRYGFTPSRDRVQVKNREGKEVYVTRYWI